MIPFAVDLYHLYKTLRKLECEFVRDTKRLRLITHSNSAFDYTVIPKPNPNIILDVDPEVIANILDDLRLEEKAFYKQLVLDYPMYGEFFNPDNQRAWSGPPAKGISSITSSLNEDP